MCKQSNRATKRRKPPSSHLSGRSSGHKTSLLTPIVSRCGRLSDCRLSHKPRANQSIIRTFEIKSHGLDSTVPLISHSPLADFQIIRDALPGFRYFVEPEKLGDLFRGPAQKVQEAKADVHPFLPGDDGPFDILPVPLVSLQLGFGGNVNLIRLIRDVAGLYPLLVVAYAPEDIRKTILAGSGWFWLVLVGSASVCISPFCLLLLCCY